MFYKISQANFFSEVILQGAVPPPQTQCILVLFELREGHKQLNSTRSEHFYPKLIVLMVDWQSYNVFIFFLLSTVYFIFIIRTLRIQFTKKNLVLCIFGNCSCPAPSSKAPKYDMLPHPQQFTRLMNLDRKKVGVVCQKKFLSNSINSTSGIKLEQFCFK